jgi:GNAT superfamily N-acetyltransferase
LVIKWRVDIVGFLHVMDREDSDYSIPVHIGWICELYVEEGFRNGGAGTLAIEAAEMWCKERGLTQVELSCNVLNVMAREWYEKRGFHTTYQVMKKVLHG